MAALNRIMNIISCFSPVKCIQYPLTLKAKFKHKAKNNYIHFCSNFFPAVGRMFLAFFFYYLHISLKCNLLLKIWNTCQQFRPYFTPYTEEYL